MPMPTSEMPFTHFNLNLSDMDKAVLESFKIAHQAEFDFSGKYSELSGFFTQIKVFVESLGDNDEASNMAMTSLILRIATEALEMFQKESAVVILRASVPHDEFKTPRWHTDGRYYDYSDSSLQMKAVTALVGPGTLFYHVTPEERREFREIPQDDRERLSELLCDSTKRESTPAHHGTVFIAGSEEHGAVHSEPHIDRHRFFMSILPGTVEQINENVSVGKMSIEEALAYFENTTS